MMVFNCFTDTVSSWFVRHSMQMPDVIRECFQQQCAEFRLRTQWYVQVLEVVSHSCLLQCCATSVFSCLSDPIRLLTQVSNY